MAYQYRGRGSLPESAGGSHGVAAYGDPSQRRKYAARKSESLLHIDQEDFRCRVVDHQRAATRCGEAGSPSLLRLLASGRGRYRQHHARDRVRERPVDKLLGNKCLGRHDYLFTVPVADGGGTGVNFRHATSKIADLLPYRQCESVFRTG